MKYNGKETTIKLYLPDESRPVTDYRAKNIVISDDVYDHYWDGRNTQYKNDVDAIADLPSAQPDWNEMIVICDCCGHAIHVQRQ